MSRNSSGQFVGGQFKHDLRGQKFERWIVLDAPPFRRNGATWWRCRCECGTERDIQQINLLGGRTKSCGCLNAELASKRFTTHGGSGTKEYWIWHGMIKRCHDPNDGRYPGYGARGISVCARWRGSFAAFMEDMGPRPSGDHSIDRFPDNKGNYEPGNCRWATATEQNRNFSRNRLLTFRGETKPAAEWSEIVGIPAGTIISRINTGFTDEQALTMPRHAKRFRRSKKPANSESSTG